jgi:PAS domain S-box-containing protein
MPEIIEPMSAGTITPNSNAWQNLQTLLRKGPSYIESMGADIPILLDILKEGKGLFDSMVDAFEGMIYICSMDFRIEYLNDRMLEHIGHDATGEFCYNAFSRKTACPWCVNHRVLRGETISWEVISPRDGRWYYVVNAPIRHIDGRVSKYAMMMDIHDRKLDEDELRKHRDHLEEIVKARTAELTFTNEQLRLEIEERKEIEKILRESQQRFQILFEGSRDAIFISDAKGRILDANEAAYKLTGYRKSELMLKFLHDLDSNFDQFAYQEYFNRTLCGDDFTIEVALRRKNGDTVFTEFSSKQITLAGIRCIHTTARNISARREAEEALRHSEAKYRELVQNANSMIVRFDTHSRVTFFNEYAQEFFGYTEKEILGRKITETILPEVDSEGRKVLDRLKDFFTKPESYKNIALENVLRNGERVVVAWTNRPIRGVDGKIIEFLSVGVDMTERRRARQMIQTLTHELIKAQETERYKIARDLHDHIAQDLSSLKIGLQTLFKGNLPGDQEFQTQSRSLIQLLQRSISEVRNLAYDLRPPGLDQFGLVRTLFTYCEDFAQANHLKIDFIAAGLDGLSLEDDIQINIYRLIQEALYNVKKHARAKGVTIRLVASSPNLMLRVIDDGVGFDVKRWQAKSHKEKRMGLQSMVERVGLLNGTIDIRSHLQKGTAIFITIPIKESYRDSQKENIDH